MRSRHGALPFRAITRRPPAVRVQPAPVGMPCKFDFQCTRPNCYFAHPSGACKRDERRASEHPQAAPSTRSASQARSPDAAPARVSRRGGAAGSCAKRMGRSPSRAGSASDIGLPDSPFGEKAEAEVDRMLEEQEKEEALAKAKARGVGDGRGRA